MHEVDIYVDVHMYSIHDMVHGFAARSKIQPQTTSTCIFPRRRRLDRPADITAPLLLLHSLLPYSTGKTPSVFSRPPFFLPAGL